MTSRRALLTPLAALWLTTLAAPAAAKPEAPRAFCETFPDAQDCQGGVVSCAQCHAGPPMLNDYGAAVGGALWADADYGQSPFTTLLGDALLESASGDADGDGVSNLEEIALGTAPGDAQDVFSGMATPAGLPNPFFKVGEYDATFAYRRVMVAYCGRSPSYDEVTALDDASDKAAYLHDALSACLDGAYWKDEGLHRMADEKIKPLKAIGTEGDIILADYDWDYRLFSYVLREGRDARDLLLAQYHIDEDDDVVEGTIARVPGSLLGTPIRVGSGQPLEVQRRAGMITTQWFFVTNSMFAQLPRTSAAQAYRAYLGQDIARGEGILPVAGEPLDVDNKGVTEATCAACHSTLDPLAYAFSHYNGIEIKLFTNPTGQYDPGRVDWPASSMLLGEPVDDLLEWAEVAANSDAFARNLADMFYSQALGHAPGARDRDEFNTLWQSLSDDDYSAEALIHRLIDTQAFGAP